MDINELVYKQKLTDQWIPLSDCKSGEILISVKTAPKSIVETEKFDMPTKPASRDDIITKGTVEQITVETENVNKPAKPSSDGEVISSVSAIEKTKVDEITIGKQAEQVGKVIIDKRESVRIEEEQPKEGVVTVEKSLTEQPQRIQGEYNIILTIMKAKNLQKKGLLGKPDPYVKLTYGDFTTKSKTVKNTYKPEWSYSTNVLASEKTPKSVLVEIYDENIGKNDFMGKIAININELVYKQKLTNQWIPLSDCKSGCMNY